MIMKKFTAFICALTVLAGGAMAMVGCGGEEEAASGEKKVMNVSLNPEVEFVLDADDKVVSVNALNEEGNLIISAESFTGKSAEDAAKLFVEVSKETGFVVSGNVKAGENEINISISGDTEKAKALYDDVKGKVDEYLSAEKITATIAQAEAITEAQLEALVAECAPYMEEAEIKAMEYAALVDALYESRKETAEFYSQELKNAYYEAKAFAMEQAELETLKSKVSGIFATACDLAYQGYSTAVSLIEDTRMSLLVDENSLYQKGLAAFRQAKIEYLDYRNEVAEMEQTAVTEEISARLAEYEATLEQAEASLLEIGVNANAQLDELKASVQEKYDAVIEALETASVKVSEHLDEVSAKQQEKKAAFFTAFEEDYAAAISAAKTSWDDMKTQLEGAENTQSASAEA